MPTSPTPERCPVPTHPIQTECCHRGGVAPTCVTMLAYEVYCHLYGSQEALVTGECRGGFGIGELTAFLYARNFPREQWRDRVREALATFRVGRRST
jgi:hypothetical protein